MPTTFLPEHARVITDGFQFAYRDSAEVAMLGIDKAVVLSGSKH
jgi:hypothetical protein